jgi:hypothetical protein
MGTKFSKSFRCITSKRLGLCAVAVLAMGALAATSFAQTCLQNEYNQVNKQKLNCTANDVSIAQVTNIRDPQTGAKLTSCIAGANFNFIADFTIKTTSAQARENIGLYIATNSTTQALTGTCVDNIISPQHQCPNAATGILCGSNNYHETDAAPDNCGDTSSSDGGGTGVEIVTLEIDNFLCEAPAGSNQVQLPNCTSWQIPGGTIQCVSPAPSYPYPFNGPGATPTAIPGSPSKCNCGIIPLGITVQTPGINVGKACTTADTPGPVSFAVNGSGVLVGSPASCTLSPEGGTATYTVDIANDKSNFGNVVVDQICDSAYGNVFTVAGFSGPPCAAGSTGQTITGTTCTAATIAANADYQCTFTASQPESKTVTDTVSANVHGSSAGSASGTSTSVQVVSNEAPSSATVTKGVDHVVQACATVRYTVDVHNSSATGTDETQTLTGLNDSFFGDITTVQGAVKATTCTIPTGGTSLTVGGSDYTCTFDGQFCSGLDTSGCISNTDKVTATLTGDESGESVTQTGNSLTVKECLTQTVTSTTP